jgi:RNA recognition motif-containing protein
MPKRIYVGNLPFNTDRVALQKLFAAYGAVETVSVPTGRSQGFGFVEFTNPKDATAAMKALAGYNFGGNRLEVTDRDTG